MASNPSLLVYTTSTVPDPIGASSSTDSATARVGIRVAAPSGNTVYCKEIDIYIPSKELSSTDSFSPKVNTTKWQTSVGALIDGSEVNLEAGTSYVPIKFSCASSSDYEINYPLILTIAVTAVTKNPGSVTIRIAEQSSESAAGPFTPPRVDGFAVNVATAGLYMRNFVASSYDASKPTEITPGGDFTNGSPIKLSWEGNASKYEVITVPSNKPVYSGTDNSFVLKTGVTDTTSFVLVGSTTDPVFAQTLYRYETLTVRITDPDISAKTLNVAGTSKLASADVAGTLGVGGAASLASTLAVKGDSTLTKAALSGTLGVAGATSLAATSVSGTLTASGTVSMLGDAVAIKPGSYTAKTDGFVVGVVGAPSGADSVCVAWVVAGTTGVGAVAVGGNTSWVATDMQSGLSYSNHGSLTLPIKKGHSWSVSVTQASSNAEDAPTSICWIPLGADGGSSFEALSEAEASQLDFEMPTIVAAQSERYRPLKEAHHLSEVVAEIFGESLPEDDLRRLAKAIMLLAESGSE